MNRIEVIVPAFTCSQKNPENPCSCEDHPVELTYKDCQIFWKVPDGKL